MKLVKYIKVKVGEYEKDGQTKGRYAIVGRVLQGDDGKEMVLLDRTFNPAGVPGDRESIILNFWDADKDNAREQSPSNESSEVPF